MNVLSLSQMPPNPPPKGFRSHSSGVDTTVRQAIRSRSGWFTIGQEACRADCSASSQESHPSLLLMLVRCKMGCCTFKICGANLEVPATKELQPNRPCCNGRRDQEREFTPQAGVAKPFGKLHVSSPQTGVAKPFWQLTFSSIQFLFM